MVARSGAFLMTRVTNRYAILATHFIDYSMELAMALSQEAEVLLLIDVGKMEKEGESLDRLKGFPITIRIISQNKLPQRWYATLRCISSILRFKPTALIAHEHAHPHVTWIMRVISWFLPIYLIVHDPFPHAGRDNIIAEENKKETLRQRACASRFLVHGAACAQALSPQVDAGKIVKIVHGPILRPENPVEIPPNRPSYDFLMIGRMEAYKGLGVLLESLKILRERSIHFTCRIVGSGPELDRLEQEFIEIEGCSVRNCFFKREEAIREIAAAQVIVVPYLEASQSGVIAAAFAQGKPVIGSNVGGIPDVIHHADNGWLVPAGDSMALAKTLHDALKREIYLTMEPTKHNKVISWDTTAKIIYSLYGK